MNDMFFGDKMDLTKWGVLVWLARKHGLGRIVQILMLRHGELAKIMVGDKEYDTPVDVFQVLRNVHNVGQGFGGVEVDIFDREFTDEREGFFDSVEAHLNGQLPGKRLVFLDPDTGLRDKKTGYQHVTSNEIKRIWGVLDQADGLALYQHCTNRRGQPWIDKKKSEFADAIGTRERNIVVGKRAGGNPQAIILFALKGRK
ncbi:MAG: hypothetical protein ACYDH9_18530 [Limisphaerales bacterium]